MLMLSWPLPAPWGPRETIFDTLLILGAVALALHGRRSRRIAGEQSKQVWFPPRLPEEDGEEAPALLAAPGHAPDAAQCFTVARQIRRRGGLVQAESFYRSCLTLAPDHLGAQGELASLLLEAGRAAEAVMAYQGLLHQCPEDADAHYNLGHAYFQLRMYPQALSAWRQAAKLSPGAKDVKTNLKLLRRMIEAEQLRRQANAPLPG